VDKSKASTRSLEREKRLRWRCSDQTYCHVPEEGELPKLFRKISGCPKTHEVEKDGEDGLFI